MTLGKILLVSSPGALIVPLIFSLRFFKVFTIPYKILALYVVGAGIIEAISYFFWLNKWNNLFLLHVYTSWEFILITIFYSFILQKKLKVFLRILLILFISFFLIDIFIISGLTHFSSYAKPVENIIIILYAIALFYKMLDEMKIKRLEKDTDFLINTAFLVYFSGTFFLFSFSNYLINGSPQTYIIWEWHVVLAWLLYTVIAIALWKNAKNR